MLGHVGVMESYLISLIFYSINFIFNCYKESVSSGQRFLSASDHVSDDFVRDEVVKLNQLKTGFLKILETTAKALTDDGTRISHDEHDDQSTHFHKSTSVEIQLTIRSHTCE